MTHGSQETLCLSDGPFSRCSNWVQDAGPAPGVSRFLVLAQQRAGGEGAVGLPGTQKALSALKRRAVKPWAGTRDYHGLLQ